ncbi:hypothetical protein JT081_02285 [Helicobacter pylori]|nr:hypothetical protein [Helicobacter phage Pt1293U]MCQ2864390.1 hypothetical protein [Helicobacter pylori]
MRQEHETATSFNQLKEITQAIMLKKFAPKNATNQESDRTQETHNANAKAHTPERTHISANANTSDRTQETGSKPKTSSHTKKGALKPTKKAFSDRQITAFRDNQQACAKELFKTKASHNANAFKTDQANNSNLRAKPSNKAFKPGLATHQEKGGNNEA